MTFLIFLVPFQCLTLTSLISEYTRIQFFGNLSRCSLIREVKVDFLKVLEAFQDIFFAFFPCFFLKNSWPWMMLFLKNSMDTNWIFYTFIEHELFRACFSSEFLMPFISMLKVYSCFCAEKTADQVMVRVHQI